MYFDQEVSASSSFSKEDPEAWDELGSLIARDGKAALSVVFRVLDKCSLPIEISRVGAGPLETTIVEYPDRFTEEIKTRAETDSRMRQALNYVSGVELPAILSRLREYA